MCCSRHSCPFIDYQDHQWVNKTCWCPSFQPHPHRPPRPPISQYNLLVCYSCLPCSFINHCSHQWVNMTHWCVVLILPVPLLTTTITNKSSWLVDVLYTCDCICWCGTLFFNEDIDLDSDEELILGSAQTHFVFKKNLPNLPMPWTIGMHSSLFLSHCWI